VSARTASYTIEGVVAFDRTRDWAILKTAAAGLRPIRLGDASQVEKGEPVIAVGYPVGLDARPTSGSFSGWLEGDILHDASTSSGNSGGPLLDKTGKAIGITRGELKSTTGLVIHDLFFAVDIKHVQSTSSSGDLHTPPVVASQRNLRQG
jgi:S1-C subfamily serine protease